MEHLAPALVTMADFLFPLSLGLIIRKVRMSDRLMKGYRTLLQLGNNKGWFFIKVLFRKTRNAFKRQDRDCSQGGEVEAQNQQEQVELPSQTIRKKLLPLSILMLLCNISPAQTQNEEEKPKEGAAND